MREREEGMQHVALNISAALWAALKKLAAEQKRTLRAELEIAIEDHLAAMAEEE